MPYVGADARLPTQALLCRKGIIDMSTSITVTRNSHLFSNPGSDQDGDGQIDPGDVIETVVHIVNTGSTESALALVLNDTFNGYTLNAGSVKITPIAFDDNYTAITGNTPITYGIGQGVLTNDIDPDGPEASLIVTKINGVALTGSPIAVTGGSVDMHADGSFSFTPTTGFNGAASFTYTIQDAQGLASVTTGTVNIPVSGLVWYVDNTYAGGGNDGSYLKPFTTIGNLNDNGTGAAGTVGPNDSIVGDDDVDGAGDTIFVYHNGPAYTNGITLEANQKLFGDGTNLLVNGHNVGGTERTGGVDNVATNSVIDNSGANGGIILSTGNTISGINVNGIAPGAVGIQDVAGGVGTLNISNVALTGQGQLLDLDQGGTATVSLTSLASTGSTGANGGVVDLTGLTTGSSLTVTGTTSITGTHSQTGIDISGNTGGVTVNFQGNVTVNTALQNALVISNNTGTNTVTFGGNANTFTTTAGNAVDMNANTTSTTVNFNNGGLNIDTTTGKGMNVDTTTLNVAGGSNTIDTTTGQILTANNAAVGANNLTFASLISTGSTTGSAISLNNLDNGSLTVTGNVTIAGTTGAGADGINVSGGSSTNIALNGTTTISGVADDGVELNASTGSFTMVGGSIGGTIGDDAINVTGGTGAVTVGATLTKTAAGNVIDVSGHATGTIAISNTISSTGTSNGISLTNNTSGNINLTGAVTLNTGANNALTFTNTAATGATLTLNHGDLNIDTTSGTGINVSSTTVGAGSLTISGAVGAGNSVVATTGRAINVDGVTADLTFHDVGKSGGTTTAIFLKNTGAGGQFVVTGDNAAGGTTGSGGTISNIDDGGTDANGATANQTGTAIYLENVSNVALSNMIFGSVTAGQNVIANLGIHGEGVNNFTLRDSEFRGNFGDTGATGPDEDTIRFGTQNAATNGLTGTVVIEGSIIQGAAKDDIAIFNGGAGSLNISFRDNASSGDQMIIGQNQNGANTGIQIQTGGTGTAAQGSGFNLTASIVNLDFQNIRADAIFIEALQKTTQNITITGNKYLNAAHPFELGGFANLNSSSAADTNYSVTYNISNNQMTGLFGTPIVAYYKGLNGNVSGIINGNTIGSPLVAGNQGDGSADGNGIFVAMEKSNGAGTLNHAVRISNNQISDLFNAAGAIALRANNIPVGGSAPGTALMEATITGNTIKDIGAQALSGIYAQLGGAGAGDNAVMGIDLKTNSINIGGSGAFTAIDLDQISTVAHYKFPGYGGPSGAASDAALETFWKDGTHLNTFPTAGSPTVFGDQTVGIQNGAFTLAVPLFAAAPEILSWDQDPSFERPGQQTPGQGGETTDPVGDGSGGSGTGSGGGTGGGGSTPPGGGTPPPPPPVVVDDGVVSQAELNLIVQAAIERWAAAGLTPEQLVAMQHVQVTVSEMAGLYVGSSSAGQVHVDSDGAGYGWFVDSTPGEDSEFDGSGSRLTADAGGAADHHIDLLTVVMHELGHQIGLDDTYASADYAELMYGYLNPGERRLPGSGDADGGVPGSLRGTDYVLGPVTNQIGDLPAGKAVDVYFTSTVGTFTNQVIPSFTNQSSVSGGNLVSSPISSTSEALVIDTLTLGNTIFLDANKNGVFNAGEGVAGVTLSLYADTNNNGTVDGAELTTAIATTTTLAGGVYSFASLAPGDYIVGVDASNFTGGALNGKLSILGGTDPDDNVDNDDNGVAGPGGATYSGQIRLDYNQEPTAGTGNDTNNTLDMGFISPNSAPVLGSIDGDITAYIEGAASPTKLDLGGDATLTDDQANFNGGSLTVHIGTGALASEDVLSASSGTVSLAAGTATVGGQNIGTYTGGTAGTDLVFSFTANATPARVQDLIRALNYSNTNTIDPSTDTRSIAITLVDGGGTDGGLGADTTVINVLVNVTPVNDAPAGADNSDTTNDSTTLVFDAANFSTGFTDPDHNAFAGVVITTLPSAADGKIQLNGVDIAALQFVTATQLANGNLTFVPVLGSGGDSPTFTFQVRDDGGVLNSGVDTDQSPNTFTLVITPSDEAPVVDLNGPDGAGNDYAAAYTEGGAAAALVDTDVTITDADSGDQVEGATISISNPFAGDQLTVVGTLPGSIVASGGGTDTITLSGTGTQAQYQTALTQIVYSSTSDNPTNYGASTTRDIGITVSDGDLPSTPRTSVITITAVNDAPVNTVGAASGATEDQDVVVTGLSVSDVDANPATQDITVTLNVTRGTLTVSTGVGGGLAAGDISGNGTGTVILTGTQNEINATLAEASGLTFNGGLNANGNVTLSMTTNDGGHTGAGAATDGPDTRIITIGAVNDAPVVAGDGTEDAAATNEDTPSAGQTVFSLFIGQYSDQADNQSAFTNGSSPGSFGGIAVTANGSSAGTGQWQYFDTNSSTWVDIGSVSNASAALINSSTQIRFDPAPDFNGAAPTLTTHLIDNSLPFGITFGQHADLSGAAATGGTTAYSTGTVVLSETVNAVNDSPAGTSATITATEDTPRVLAQGDFGFSDVDSGDTLASVTFTAVTGGKLYYDADGAGGADPVQVTTFPATYSAADIGAGKLAYLPNANLNGTGVGTIGFQVTDSSGAANATDPSANTLTVDVTPINDTPVVPNSPTIVATEGSVTTINPALTVSDVDLDARNGGNGDYGGAQFLMNRDVSNSEDQFIITGGSGFTVTGTILAGGDLQAGGLTFGHWVSNSGVLQIDFNSTQTAATTALVNAVLQSIQYNIASDTPPSSITLLYGLNDGAPDAVQGALGAPFNNFDGGQVIVNITATNDAPFLDLLNPGAGTDSTISYAENDPATVLATTATIIDPDSTDFDTGVLTVAFGATGTATDRLTIIDQGPGAGQIGVIGANVTYGGVAFASFTGGTSRSSSPSTPMPARRRSRPCSRTSLIRTSPTVRARPTGSSASTSPTATAARAISPLRRCTFRRLTIPRSPTTTIRRRPRMSRSWAEAWSPTTPIRTVRRSR
jgi:hypothetical protein